MADHVSSRSGLPCPDDPNKTDLDRVSPAADDGRVWWGGGGRSTFVFSPDHGPAAANGRDDDGLTLDLSVSDSQSSAPAPEPPSRYRVESEIARGGVGAILQGWDLQLQRPVAIKVLLEEHKAKPRVVRRFMEEARITSRLQHPGIVPIHDLGLSPDNRPFFVMRLVCGQTLEHLLRRRDNPADDLPRLFTIFHQVCQTIAYTHSQDVIHRDLKPANVMVGAFGVVNVMDWGLAKVLGEPDLPDAVDAAHAAANLSIRCSDRPACDGLPGTQVGTVFGTPAYLPPEQARGEIDQLDQRADVFGLGSLLCEILTGRPPYTGADGRAIYDKAVAADLEDALGRLDASTAPLDMISLAKWCLSPAPSDRPRHAGDVVEVMTAFLQASQRRAEQDLVRFFDLSLDMFCIAGTEGFFHRVNENFPRLLGYTATELTSRPFIDFVHPDDRAKTGAELIRISDGEPCVQFVNRYRHSRGHYVWLEWNAQTVPEERAIYAVARDVTERVNQAEAASRAEQLRVDIAAITDTIVVAVIDASQDGTVESWNSGAEALFGYSAVEMIGRPLRCLFAPERVAESDDVLARARRGERVELASGGWSHKDGHTVAATATVSPARNYLGHVVGVVCVARGAGEPGVEPATD